MTCPGMSKLLLEYLDYLWAASKAWCHIPNIPHTCHNLNSHELHNPYFKFSWTHYLIMLVAGTFQGLHSLLVGKIQLRCKDGKLQGNHCIHQHVIL
eukprot:sb/3479222/